VLKPSPLISYILVPKDPLAVLIFISYNFFFFFFFFFYFGSKACLYENERFWEIGNYQSFFFFFEENVKLW
jgi:hypothetical protein